jgi:hypothetical protein
MANLELTALLAAMDEVTAPGLSPHPKLRRAASLALPSWWNQQRYHQTQRFLWYTKSRFTAVPAGRRSGKTEFAKRRLIAWLPVQRDWRNPRYFYGGPTYGQARRIAWDHLLNLIPPDWIRGGRYGRNVSRGDMRIKTIFGSELWVIGLDSPQRVEGDPWDGCILDESSDLKEGAFTRSIRPALSDRQGWCWRIGVPKRAGLGAREYRLFCEACEHGAYPDGACYTWPSADILPAHEIAQARATLDPKDFREQYGASWETAGGAIFFAWDRAENCRPCEYRPGLPIIVGSDFNVDPMCWCLGHKVDNTLEWFDEVWMRDTNTQRSLDALWQRYSAHKGGFEFYGDASGRARKTSSSTSDYLLILGDKRFQQAGRKIRYPETNPLLRDRFAACNAMFLNADADRRMFVDPKCTHLIDDIETRAYKPGTSEPADAHDQGHMTDAMGYAVFRLFPIKYKAPGQSAVIIGGQ